MSTNSTAPNPLKLDLPIQEVNLILTSLARMPFESVAGLIENIQTQARSQLGSKESLPESSPAAAQESCEKAP